MLTSIAISQLLSLKNVLDQIKDEDYAISLNTLKGMSISKHVRHVVEFYECLLFNCIDNTLCYDDRKRNMLLEENVKYTLDYITEIIDALEKIESNKRLLLIAKYQEQRISMESSLYRELTYNIEHTVHHLAIIGIALPIHFPYIHTPENFGFADSTIQYLKTQVVSQ
ncbi:MAG: DinB family protein [Bacteroidia bacterium]